MILSGAAKSPLLVFYVNDVLNRQNSAVENRSENAVYLRDVLEDSMAAMSNWLVTTEINFEGMLRKAKKTSMVRCIVDEIDTIVNEHTKKDPSKLCSNHFIHLCDSALPEVGKELSQDCTVQQAPKVVITVGDQPDEMMKYTPYSKKGESYRLDPICGDIQEMWQMFNSSRVLIIFVTPVSSKTMPYPKPSQISNNQISAHSFFVALWCTFSESVISVERVCVSTTGPPGINPLPDTLKQGRNCKKINRTHCAEVLNRRYAAVWDATKKTSTMELAGESMGAMNVIESAVKDALWAGIVYKF